MGNTVVDVTLGIEWSFEHWTEESKLIKAINTCALDTVLNALYMLRKHDDELFLDFKRDTILSHVLDLIQCRQYAEARHTWIVHSEADQDGKLFLSRKTEHVSDDGTFVEKWNCNETIFNQVASMKLFHFDFNYDYEECSNGDVNCEQPDKYMDGKVTEKNTWKKEYYRVYQLVTCNPERDNRCAV